MPIGEGSWVPVALSVTPFDPQHTTPRALSEAQIEALVQAFVRAVERSLATSSKITKVYTAHGYLLHQSLLPLSNQCRDQYGGCFENRIRLPLRVTTAVHKAWPEELPLLIRPSAIDRVEDGWNPDRATELARRLKDLGVDLIDVFSGGTTANVGIPIGLNYQAEFAEQVKREAGITGGTVGMITEPARTEHILRTDQVGLIPPARELLRDPYRSLHTTNELRDEQMPRPP